MRHELNLTALGQALAVVAGALFLLMLLALSARGCRPCPDGCVETDYGCESVDGWPRDCGEGR